MLAVFIFRLAPLNLKIGVRWGGRQALRGVAKFCAFNCGIFKFADRIYAQILSSSLAKFTAEKAKSFINIKA